MRKFVNRIMHKAQQSFRHRGLTATLRRAMAAPYFVFLEYRRSRQEFDWKFGVDTDGSIPLLKLKIDSPNWVYGAEYGATGPEVFWEALLGLSLHYEDFVFVDLGSGKGRVILMASELPFKEIVGVEFSPELNKIAEQNIRRYKSGTQRCKRIRLVCADFTVFSFPRDPTFFFLFYPRREPVMQALVKHIHDSVLSHPRDIYILYVNPQLGRMFEDA